MKRLGEWLADSGLAWRLAGVAVVGIAVLVAGDNRFSWSANQPVVMTIVTDLVQIVLIAAVFESVRRHREQKRVDEVGRIMFRALAQAALDCTRRLDAHLAGWALETRGVPHWDAARTAEIRSHLASVGLPVTGLMGDDDRSARLALLLPVHGFSAALYREMSEHKRRFHDELGRWSPLLLATDARIQDLAHMRRLADDFGVLHQSMYHGAVTVVPAADWVAAPAWVAEVQLTVAEFTRGAERARAFYHGLAEEQRRLHHDELDEAQAVTTQPPAYLAAARRPPPTTPGPPT